MKKIKDTKGITMITLVVTIILLLILAGASINIIIKGDGLFSRARKSTDAYNDVATNETKILNKYDEYNDEMERAYALGEITRFEIIITNTTSNEITVTPKVLEINCAGIEYYIKEEEENEYRFVEEINNIESYTYTGLTQNKTYDIKVIAKGKKGHKVEKTTKATTREIVQPIVTFTYDPDGWTNGSVKVTAEADEIEEGMTLYIGEEVENCTTLASTGITVSSNKYLYAVYKDSTGQYGGAAVGEVSKIDKTKPVVNSIDVTTNKATINATDTAGENERASQIAKYALTTTNEEPAASQFQESNVFENRTQGTTYYGWAIDNAGNISLSKSESTSTVLQPSVSFAYEPNDWTNGSVKVTASVENEESGMTLYIGEDENNCTTLASTGITVSSNKNIYAVYKDSTGQYGAAAVGEVSKIDKDSPNNTAPTRNSSTATSITLNYNQQDALSKIPNDTTHRKYRLTNAAGTTGTWQTSNSFTGLNAGTTYYFQTYAKDAAGNEKNSQVATIITDYSISYALNGGSISGQKTSYRSDTESFNLTTPTKSGYTFTGWTSENNLCTGLEGYTTSNPYTCAKRDHAIGNSFDVTPGTIYRVFVTAKRTSGNLALCGGIWYTSETSGAPYDGYAGEFKQLESYSNGWAKYYKDVAVPSGKTKGQFYIQLEQDHGGGSTQWQIANAEIFIPNKTVTIAKGSTGNKSYTANWVPTSIDLFNRGWKSGYVTSVSETQRYNNGYIKLYNTGGDVVIRCEASAQSGIRNQIWGKTNAFYLPPAYKKFSLTMYTNRGGNSGARR